MYVCEFRITFAEREFWKSGTKHLVSNSLQIFSNGSKLNGTVHCRIPLEPMVIFISILDHCSVFQPIVDTGWKRIPYLHNRLLQLFSQDYGLTSHITHVVRVLILYLSGGTYSLTSTLNDKFLRDFFMAGLFCSQSFCQKSAERKSPKKYFFHILKKDY